MFAELGLAMRYALRIDQANNGLCFTYLMQMRRWAPFPCHVLLAIILMRDKVSKQKTSLRTVKERFEQTAKRVSKVERPVNITRPHKGPTNARGFHPTMKSRGLLQPVYPVVEASRFPSSPR